MGTTTQSIYKINNPNLQDTELTEFLIENLKHTLDKLGIKSAKPNGLQEQLIRDLYTNPLRFDLS